MDDEYLSQCLTQESNDIDMPYTGKRKYGRKKYTTSWQVKKKRRSANVYTKTRMNRMSRSLFAKRVMRIVNNRAETKERYNEWADNQTLKHNVITNLNANIFRIGLGFGGDEMNTTSGGSAASRIGQRVYIKGVSFRMILESQQYRSNCTYWLYALVNKESTATIASSAEMFENLTDQLPTDYIDTDKVRVLWCKKFTPKMPNPGADNAMNTSGVGASDGNAHPVDGPDNVPNPKIIKKWYWPVNKYVDYQDGTGAGGDVSRKDRVQLVVVAYNNNSTIDNGSTWPCGHIWLSGKIYFTDV